MGRFIHYLVSLNVIVLVWLAGSLRAADQPCAGRDVSGRSVLCVCNDSYCDQLAREQPTRGTYLVYTSSEGGLRFNKTRGVLQAAHSSQCCSTTFVLEPDTTHQTIEGFGGAVTDSAAINWKTLSPTLQKHLIDSYFGPNGLQYNMVRVPIGGTDFSPRPYAYNDLPENDTRLSNFTLANEDKQYKIPMIKAIMKASTTPIKIVATTWSPPVWMKTNHEFYGSSRIKPEYFQTYADYHYKFLQKYAAEGVNVWAITTTNEPVNGVVPLARFNSLGWSPGDMGKWIAENLGPTLRNSTFKDVKILAVDDQRYTIPLWFDVMLTQHPEALQYVAGVAVHYYGDYLTPASFLSSVPRMHPGKFVLATEACEGSFPWQSEKVALGAWDRAKNYVLDIIEDLNHDVVGWLDWNLCLDSRGGPNWAANYVDSAVVVLAPDEFVKQPMFYAVGHFAKFVPRGSRRISVVEDKGFLTASVEHVAFLTPRNTVVAVFYNKGESKKVLVKLKKKRAELQLEASSVTTVEFSLG